MSQQLKLAEVKESDLVESQYPLEINIPELRVVCSKQVPNNDEYYVVYCEPKDYEEQRCPHCAESTAIMKNGFAKPRIVHDINFGMHQVDLKITVPKYRCRGCGKDFSHKFREIMPKRNMTNRLYKQFKWMAFTHPFDDVAFMFHCAESTVKNVYGECVQEYACMHGLTVAPNALGLRNKKIGRANSTILVNAETAELLDIYYGKNQDVNFPINCLKDNDNIRIVVMDLLEEYRTVAQKTSPHAKLIVHKTAVEKLVQTYIAKVGRKVLRKLANNHRDMLNMDQIKVIYDLIEEAKKDAYLFDFFRGGSRENTKRQRVVDDLCKTFPEFAHLYKIRFVFGQIYPMNYTDDSSRYAEDMYKRWRWLIPQGEKGHWAPGQRFFVSPELFAELIPLVNILDSWREEILEYVKFCQKKNLGYLSAVDDRISTASLSGRDRNSNRIRDRAIYWPLAMQHGRGYRLVKKGSNTLGSHFLLAEHLLTGDTEAKQVLCVEEVSGAIMTEMGIMRERKFYKLVSE